jgi:hypothetical protein
MTTTVPTTQKTRTLHLVDIENLVGDPCASRVEALDALNDYLDLAGYREGDHLIVAANPRLIQKIAFDLHVPCNVHAATGKDGADLSLLSHAEPTWVAARFDRLVIGSGDAEFVNTALAVRDHGTPVVIVSRRNALSSQLQGQALGIRILEEPALVLAV